MVRRECCFWRKRTGFERQDNTITVNIFPINLFLTIHRERGAFGREAEELKLAKGGRKKNSKVFRGSISPSIEGGVWKRSVVERKSSYPP